MRIGFIGPADGNHALLREAAEFLLGDAEVERVIYLGQDGALTRVADEWAAEIAEWATDRAGFFDRALQIALDGDAAAIRALLEADRSLERLGSLRTLPPVPTRAIEMIDDRIVTVVWDKDVLTEGDIANSMLLVYGRSDQDLLKRFGRRYFFTPGPLSSHKVAVFEATADGIAASMFAPSGAPLWSEQLVTPRKNPRVTVAP